MYSHKTDALQKIASILSVIYVLIIVITSLSAFQSEAHFIDKLLLFMSYQVFTLLLIGSLYSAKKNSRLGGYLFIVIGAILTLYFNTYHYILSFLAISLPLFIIGILFIANSIKQLN